jgi:hypothetical protein
VPGFGDHPVDALRGALALKMPNTPVFRLFFPPLTQTSDLFLLG